MLLAVCFFALMNVAVKFLPHIPAIEIILFRSVFSFIFSYMILKRKSVPVLGNNRKLLVLRGVVGSVGLITFFYTLQNIPLASAVTIQYLGPIFTSILGIFIVKEKVKPKQFVFFAIAFLGVLTIEGFDPRIDALFLGIGIVSALFSGLAYNVIRKLKNTEHPLVIVFYFPLVTCCGCFKLLLLGTTRRLGLGFITINRYFNSTGAVLHDHGLPKCQSGKSGKPELYRNNLCFRLWLHSL